MVKYIFYLVVVFVIYSCTPINKQHGYLIDDIIISSQEISQFEVNITTKKEVYDAMGSPSIEIQDVDHVWIYLLSLKEKKVFEDDVLLFQNIYRFAFDDAGILMGKSILTEQDFKKIAFSSDKTKVRRDAYGITDQLYDTFTRGN